MGAVAGSSSGVGARRARNDDRVVAATLTSRGLRRGGFDDEAGSGLGVFAEPPEVLTVEEAAEARRIGRTLAYELARCFEASGGSAGLPVLLLGRVLGVPKAAPARVLADELTLEGRPRHLPLYPIPARALLARRASLEPPPHGAAEPGERTSAGPRWARENTRDRLAPSVTGLAILNSRLFGQVTSRTQHRQVEVGPAGGEAQRGAGAADAPMRMAGPIVRSSSSVRSSTCRTMP